MASQWQAQAMVRQHIDEATCHKRNACAVQRFNESTAIRTRLGDATTQGIDAPVPRAGFDWALNRAPDALKSAVNHELASLQALERRIRQVDQYFDEQASVSHDSPHDPLDAKISQQGHQLRVHDKQSLLQPPLLPPHQQIFVQARDVVSPLDQRASATTRTSLRQSSNQPFQSHAQDIPSKLYQSPTYGTQINTQSASRTRDKPSNQPQSQACFDQPQTYEPRIPLQPPSTTFSPQESWQKPQAPIRRFEKKAGSEAQTSERGDGIALAGFERFQGVDKAIRTLPNVAEKVHLRQHDRSSLKHARSPSNDCGSAQTQVVDYGGEARLPQATASKPPQKKVCGLFEQDYSLGTSADVEKEVVDDWQLLPGEPQPTPPESGQRPNMSHTRPTHPSDVEVENDIVEDDDGALDDELLCSSPVPTTKQLKHQPKAPVVQDILRTQQRQSPQAPPVSQDISRTQQRQSPRVSSASQDTPHAQLSQSPQVSSAAQDTSHARLSQSPQVSSAIQDNPHAQLSQKPRVSSAIQDNPHAQLSQKPRVSSAAQDDPHAQLSRTPPKPSATHKSACAHRSESAQPSPAAPTNHNPTNLLPLLPLRSPSVQWGLKSLTSGDCEDSAPPQHSESPPATDSSALLPWSPSPIRRVDARRQDVANALDTQDEHMLHTAVYGECALQLDAEKYDFSAIVAPFAPGPAATNTKDEELVSATPRAGADDGTFELEASTGSVGPPDADRLSPEEQRWLDGAAQSSPRKLAVNDVVDADHDCRMYLAKHPQTVARARHYVWALFTMLRYDLPTVKELQGQPFDPALIDSILTELGDFNAFWLEPTVAFHQSSNLFRIDENIAGPHPGQMKQILDRSFSLHQMFLCKCGKPHNPWSNAIHIIRIGCGLFEDSNEDYQISHLSGIACIANPKSIRMESGNYNRSRKKCHSGTATTCNHTPPCQFIPHRYQHMLQNTIALRTIVNRSLTDKTTHYCSPCDQTITGSTRDWVVHVSRHSQSVFMGNSDEYAVLCPGGNVRLDDLTPSKSQRHFVRHRVSSHCVVHEMNHNILFNTLPPGIHTTSNEVFWKDLKTLEVDPEQLRRQMLRLDYKPRAQTRKQRPRAGPSERIQEVEDEDEDE
ncbi:hypothetical protein LTR27_003302 [Elasticomyces elasticus]|nr:hypothetical protein LTR27_003302 [Elasticomyces elasticus]